MGDLAIRVDDIELEAVWSNENPGVRQAIEQRLPITVDCRRWGEELYGTVEIDVTPERTSRRVDPGTLAYWPDGPAVCLFWGPTPASTDDTPVAASPVAPFATVTAVDPLREQSGDARLTIDRLEATAEGSPG